MILTNFILIDTLHNSFKLQSSYLTEDFCYYDNSKLIPVLFNIVAIPALYITMHYVLDIWFFITSTSPITDLLDVFLKLTIINSQFTRIAVCVSIWSTNWIIKGNACTWTNHTSWLSRFEINFTKFSLWTYVIMAWIYKSISK